MKWDLTYFFSNEQAFEEAYAQSLQIIEKLATYKGKLHNQQSFKEYFLLQKEIEKTGLPAYQYARLRSDLNKKDMAASSQLQKVQIAFSQLQQAVSFEQPEVISLGKELVMKFVNESKDLEEFRFSFEKLFRRQEHILDDNSEALIAVFSDVSNSGKNLYSSLTVADIENGDIMLDNGEIVTITNSNFHSFIKNSSSASERKDIFESIFSYYELHKNTYASIYKHILEADYALMKARKYSSSLESYLFNNAIPVEVYNSLINVAKNSSAILRKYIKIRKKALHLSKYHTYDRFLELAKSDKEYEYSEAKDLFFQSISNFPDTFKDKAQEALKDGFVDVYEKPGKRTGAYSSSIANLHPFILLNYSKTLNDVFTVAHEAGHSIHSMFAAEAQPSSLQDYTIFVAEVASTFNEHNLLDYFIKNSKASKNEKIALLQRAIDDIASTFYRQSLLARYELEAHKLVENKQPITSDTLSKIMINLYQEFYGIDIEKEEMKQFVWAYIPHLFYTPFYVYQYATSFAASLKIYEDVKNQKLGAFDKYIGLLRSGGSKYPIEQLQEAGVDLTKEDAFMAVATRMSELVNQLELVIKQK
jgi:oligoendopeptidase F